MWHPMRWLLRVGGVLPKNTKIDNYFLYQTLVIDLYYVLFSMYYYHISDHSSTALAMHILDLTTCTMEMMIVIKLHYLRESFTCFINKCLVSEQSPYSKYARGSENIIFLVVCLVLVTRVVCRSTASGEPVVLYDVLLMQFYFPSLCFVVIMHHINVRFSKLNDEFRELANSLQTDNTLTISSLRTELCKVFRTHICLRDLLNCTSGFFGVFTACITCFRVVYITHSVYKILVLLTDPRSNVPLIDVLVMLTVFAMTVSQCDICYKVSEKVQLMVYFYYII